MSSYMIFGKSFNGAFTIVFNQDGSFQKLINETDIRDHDGIIDRIGKLPYEERHIPALKAKGVKVEKLQEDLSFERFWRDYNYKLGKKARVEKLWGLLKDCDKLLALNGIKPYDIFLSNKTIEKAYAETYLSQRRWENFMTTTQHDKTLFS